MRRPARSLLVILTVALAGCELLALGSSSATDRTASPGEPFEVGFGETVTLRGADLEIRFAGVEDSRCPEDVRCVWAGEARATFRVTSPRADRTIDLRIPPQDPGLDAALVDGFRIRLVDLRPMPHSARPSGDRLYRARLLVEPVDAG